MYLSSPTMIAPLVAAATLSPLPLANNTCQVLMIDPTPRTQTEGDVFGLVTSHSGNPAVHLRAVNVYPDGTLGIDDVEGGYQFQGVIFSDHGIIFQPEPILVLDVQPDHTLKFVDSLYNPTIGWSSTGNLALNEVRSAVVCPSWPNNRLYWANEGFSCPDQIGVDIITVELPSKNEIIRET